MFEVAGWWFRHCSTYYVVYCGKRIAKILTNSENDIENVDIYNENNDIKFTITKHKCVVALISMDVDMNYDIHVDLFDTKLVNFDSLIDTNNKYYEFCTKLLELSNLLNGLIHDALKHIYTYSELYDSSIQEKDLIFSFYVGIRLCDNKLNIVYPNCGFTFRVDDEFMSKSKSSNEDAMRIMYCFLKNITSKRMITKSARSVLQI